MCQGVARPTEAIKLPNSSNSTLAETLALLRFVYEPKAVILENIHLLSLQGNLEGVLRLANSIDCTFLDDCKRLANQLLLNWPRASNALGASHAVSQVNHEFNHVKAMLHFSSDIKDDDLHEGCYEYVRKRWLEATAYLTHPMTCEDTVALIRELGDYPDLLRAALFYSMRWKRHYTGKTIRRVLDCENYIPNALYTFKFQFTGNEYNQSIGAMYDPKNEGFTWNEHRYDVTILILKYPGKYHLCVGIPIHLPQRPKADITFRVFNWTDPSKSITIPMSFDFNDAAPSNYYCWAEFTFEELISFLDEDGIWYVQVTEYRDIQRS